MSLVPRYLRVALVLGVAVLVVPLGLTVAHSAAPSAAASAPSFSHEVVTDMQRSGFEPGIQVDGKDRLYSSVPYGFSDTQSFLWKSADNGNSFHLTPGSVGSGKTQTCVGGGDSELALDAKDNLFFSDLQGLTNLSNSVTKDQGKTFSASCTSSPNTPVDRMWYAVHGNLGDPDFAIYEEYDDVNGAVSTGGTSNQLVETVSHDGVNFLPVINSNPADPNCLGGGVANCVTNDEGIPGNQVLSADGKTIYIAHTSSDSNKVVVSVGTLATNATTGAVTATWKHVQVNTDLCPDAGGKPGASEHCGSALFSTLAQDTAGNLYVVAASKTVDAKGVQTSPYDVYLWTSTDKGSTWSSKAKTLSSGGSNAFPWITAGDPGRIDATWYHATLGSQDGKFDFDSLTKGSFTVEMAQSLNALDPTPSVTRSTVSEHPVKYGPICTQGLNCTTSGGDRSLGDYLQVSHDARGAAVVAFVDDTSNAFTTGPAAQGSQVANTGPSVVSRQVAGPSLFTAVGTVTGAGAGPANPVDSITDPTGDAIYSANSMETPSGDNTDLTGVRVSDDGASLTTTMKVKNLSSLMLSPTAGGTTGEWITRFTTYNAGATPGNGHIYYLGMESVGGGAPTFFAGDTQRARLFMTYQQEKPATGSYDAKTGTVSVTTPLSTFKGAGSGDTMASGSTLYSATAFTASTAGPLKGNPEGLFNLLDATSPLNHVVGTNSTPATASATPTATTSPKPMASGTATPSTIGALRVGVSPARVVAGQPAKVTITGSPGTDVELLAYTRPSTAYRVARRGRVDRTGRATFNVTPDGNARLYARPAVGSSARSGGNSNSVTINVAASVSLQDRRTGTRTYVFGGHHLPVRPGQLITLYRRSGAKLIQVDQTRTDDSRTWSLRRTFAGIGTFHFLASVGRSSSNDPGNSQDLAVTIR